MLAKAARKLCEEIDYGIRTYGIYRHPRFGDIFAYETDGFGNYNLIDDANAPSLLSIPYLQYTTKLYEAFDDITVVLKVLLKYRNRLRTTNSVERLNQKLDVGNG